jgi:hypothetical protein
MAFQKKSAILGHNFSCVTALYERIHAGLPAESTDSLIFPNNPRSAVQGHAPRTISPQMVFILAAPS